MSDATMVESRLTPRDPGAVTRFAEVEELRRRGDHAAAARAAMAALAEFPYDADGHHLLARIHAAQGDAQRARDEWEMALRLDPGHPGARQALESRSLPAAGAQARRSAAGTPAPSRAPQSATVARDAYSRDARPSVGHPGMPSFDDPRVIAALLTDADGMVVAQHTTDGVSNPACEAIGALLSSLARDTTEVLGGLGLGALRTLSVECSSGGLGLSPAPEGHVVIVAVRASTPLGLARRYLLTAQRHARLALEGR